MNILLVDDHHLFRSGLRLLLTGLTDKVVFFEAESLHAALSFSHESKFDLVLLDYYLEDEVDHFDALQAIKAHYDCRVVVVSGEEDAQIIRAVIEHGAAGFIPKSSSPEVLTAALRLVLANGIYLPPHVLNEAASRQIDDKPRTSDDQQRVLSQLSARQFKVLMCAAEGQSNKCIARSLYIAEGTVKAHLSACFRVLDVHNRTEAVFALAKLGLTEDA